MRCRQYFSKGSRAPEITYVEDSITIEDAFPLEDAAVTVDITHRRIGALVVSLTAQPLSSSVNGIHRVIMLKDRGLGRLGGNMYMTTFSDNATKSFPEVGVRLLHHIDMRVFIVFMSIYSDV